MHFSCPSPVNLYHKKLACEWQYLAFLTYNQAVRFVRKSDLGFKKQLNTCSLNPGFTQLATEYNIQSEHFVPLKIETQPLILDK